MSSVNEQIRPSRFAELYAKIRSSTAFLVVLLAYVAVWMALHLWWGFDPDLGGFNSILSSEASINLAVFGMLAEAQYQWNKRQMKVLQHVAEATHALLRTQVEASERQEKRDRMVVRALEMAVPEFKKAMDRLTESSDA